jgi:hypothetical protein
MQVRMPDAEHGMVWSLKCTEATGEMLPVPE